MKVVDSGVVIDFLLGGLDPAVLQGKGIAAPHLLDSEVTQVLRRLVHRGELADHLGHEAMVAFVALGVYRFGIAHLRMRVWELKDIVSAYDATYVALAESLDLPLVTTDRRLASAPGLRCQIEVA